jgi:hypothetical protein
LKGHTDTVEQDFLFILHVPSLHINGLEGGQGVKEGDTHLLMFSTHEPSQHFTKSNGHVVALGHNDIETTHDPSPHLNNPFSQTVLSTSQ